MMRRNNQQEILSGTLAGTSAMTLFSYFISHFQKSNFREPELLAILAHRLAPDTDKALMRMAGWLIHYAVGLGFVRSYSLLWQKTKLKPTPSVGLLLGGVSGILGASVWKMVFRLHPNPPRIEFKNYYRQLIVAHMLFGLIATLAYKQYGKAE